MHKICKMQKIPASFNNVSNKISFISFWDDFKLNAEREKVEGLVDLGIKHSNNTS